MTSGTNKHPFAPGPAITRDQLLAYVEERASAREQFEVEFAMEHDPLLADAIEGYKIPGAIDGLKELEEHRPGSSFNPWNWSFPIVLMIAILSIPIRVDQQNGTAVQIAEEQIGVIREEIPFQIETEEKIEELTEIHSEGDLELIVPTAANIDRNGTIEHLRPIKIDLPTTISRDEGSLPIARKERSGLQLHYVHDLKILHPKELYPFDPMVELANGSVTADRSDRSGNDLKILQPVEESYLNYMDHALKHFRTDPRLCLEELIHLLDQYPDDPNALFYAGMCHLETRNFRSAAHYLSRALKHRSGVFNEEADFYHAIAIEGKGDRKAATRALEKIAEENGFYSGRARERIRDRSSDRPFEVAQ